MKQELLLTILLMLSISLNLSSCSKEDENNQPSQQTESNNTDTTSGTNTEEEKEDVRYYVKYELTSTTGHAAVNRNLKFTTENGTQTLIITPGTTEKNVTWEGTYGPVKKGFLAFFLCNIVESERSSTHARIYVCREKEPFVVKADGSGNSSISLGYTIDF